MEGTTGFQETRPRLAIFDERFVKALSGFDPADTSAIGAEAAALLQVGVSVAIGMSAISLQWNVTRALTAGATKDEITDVLPVIARWPNSAGSSLPLSRWQSPSTRLDQQSFGVS